MTYLSFHLIFTVPPILAATLVLLNWKGARWLLRKSKAIGLLAVIAVAYTTPWDNYLVYKEVWFYGRERVLGTIGFVPVEEYAFFILQTILVGLLLLIAAEWRPEVRLPIDRPPRRAAVAGFLVMVLASGIVCLGNDSTLYLGLITAWAAPVMLLQWLLGSQSILQRLRHWIPVVVACTVYLGAADRIAISEGTWSISEGFTTGRLVFGLPVEEALFFLVTNIMVVWGILLFEHYEDRKLPWVKGDDGTLGEN